MQYYLDFMAKDDEILNENLVLAFLKILFVYVDSLSSALVCFITAVEKSHILDCPDVILAVFRLSYCNEKEKP